MRTTNLVQLDLISPIKFLIGQKSQSASRRLKLSGPVWVLWYSEQSPVCDVISSDRPLLSFLPLSYQHVFFMKTTNTSLSKLFQVEQSIWYAPAEKKKLIALFLKMPKSQAENAGVYHWQIHNNCHVFVWQAVVSSEGKPLSVKINI